MKKIILVLLMVMVFAGISVNAQGIFFKFSDSPTVYKAYSSEEEFLKDGGDWNAIQNFDEPVVSFGGGLGDYQATTTASNATGFANDDNPTLLRATSGTLGSLIITKAGTAGGVMNFYNATTTNVLKRTGNIATTTILIASVPTDLAAGTYNFDVAFETGLIVDYTGTIGTSTITFR